MLALELRQEAERLRFYDPGTPSCLLSSAEEQQGRLREAAARRQAEAAQSQAEARLHDEAAAHRQAEARLHDEAAARRQAEARIAALEALLHERGGNDTPGR